MNLIIIFDRLNLRFLLLIETIIATLQCDQFFVSTLFDDRSLIHHHNHICTLNRAQTVSNKEDSLVFKCFGKIETNLTFAVVVEGTSRLI